MMIQAIVFLTALVILSVPIAAVLGWLGLFMSNFHSFMPLHLAIGDIFWQNSIEFLLVAIPMFVLMGEILLRSGITERMYEGMVQWLGWLPGGLMHSNIGACALFAATSGSSVATAATIGTVALPEVEKRNYNERLFLGTIAAGGTLGILIPPSINLIIYGLLTDTSVPELYLAGFIPGIMLAGLFMLTVAVACLIRSVGTQPHRMPHTGGMFREGALGALPAAALSGPDADQLTRLLDRGPVRVNLDIGVEYADAAPSGNVIAEVEGSDLEDEIILIGCHLDSWDLGTGALDDGAGCGIVVGAAKLIADLPGKPRRTIRVVLYGSEEVGLFGANAYARQHGDDLDKHMLAAESDFGAGRIWRFQTNFGEAAISYADVMKQVLTPLGVSEGDNAAGGGPDIGVLRRAGVPVVTPAQDGRDYFDYHHTPDDTFDKIDPEAFRQNVAVYAAFTYIAAQTGWDFRKSEPTLMGSD